MYAIRSYYAQVGQAAGIALDLFFGRRNRGLLRERVENEQDITLLDLVAAPHR